MTAPLAPGSPMPTHSCATLWSVAATRRCEKIDAFFEPCSETARRTSWIRRSNPGDSNVTQHPFDYLQHPESDGHRSNRCSHGQLPSGLASICGHQVHLDRAADVTVRC